ncbi:unnamed protein product [Cuscuta epithymum]|uniref:Uncharacterized protein n=1 Tax=Cuscuta epithymum TaxID=186058 RepID=A0AAV0DYZ5_9ASTE|nr:unnamed protein product [Cuscuta epithymum]
MEKKTVSSEGQRFLSEKMLDEVAAEGSSRKASAVATWRTVAELTKLRLVILRSLEMASNGGPPTTKENDLGRWKSWPPLSLSCDGGRSGSRAAGSRVPSRARRRRPYFAGGPPGRRSAAEHGLAVASPRVVGWVPDFSCFPCLAGSDKVIPFDRDGSG